MKRWQWIVMFAWVGLPLLVMISLFVLSLGYMQYMFTPMDREIPDVMSLFLGFTGLNFTVLLFGFIIANQRHSREKPKTDDNKKRLSCRTLFFNEVTLSFFYRLF